MLIYEEDTKDEKINNSSGLCGHSYDYQHNLTEDVSVF